MMLHDVVSVCSTTFASVVSGGDLRQEFGGDILMNQ